MVGDLREWVKPAFEWFMAGEVAGRLGQRLRRGQRLILAYHNVVLGGSPPFGERTLHLSFDDFRRQADALVKRGSVAPLAEALEPNGGEPRFAITFDDAYASAVWLALPELSRRGLPATLFVAPGLLGQPVTWWDALASAPTGLPDTARESCLTDFEGDGKRIFRWMEGRVPTPAHDDRFRIASEDELAQVADLPGVTLGAHSWSHPNLTQLSDDQLRIELEEPLQWLRKRFPDSARFWLAYPYGRYDKRVMAAASTAGYQAGFGIRGGWHRPPRRSMARPRLNIPAGLSEAGMAARLNGLASF